jgi:hypothetical protein
MKRSRSCVRSSAPATTGCSKPAGAANTHFQLLLGNETNKVRRTSNSGPCPSNPQSSAKPGIAASSLPAQSASRKDQLEQFESTTGRPSAVLLRQHAIQKEGLQEVQACAHRVCWLLKKFSKPPTKEPQAASASHPPTAALRLERDKPLASVISALLLPEDAANGGKCSAAQASPLRTPTELEIDPLLSPTGGSPACHTRTPRVGTDSCGATGGVFGTLSPVLDPTRVVNTDWRLDQPLPLSWGSTPRNAQHLSCILDPLGEEQPLQLMGSQHACYTPQPLVGR